MRWSRCGWAARWTARCSHDAALCVTCSALVVPRSGGDGGGGNGGADGGDAALTMWMRRNWPGALAAAWAGSLAYLTALAPVLHSDLKERLDSMITELNQRLDDISALHRQVLQAHSGAAASGSSAPKVWPGNGPDGRGGRCRGLGAGEAWPKAPARAPGGVIGTRPAVALLLCCAALAAAGLLDVSCCSGAHACSCNVPINAANVPHGSPLPPSPPSLQRPSLRHERPMPVRRRPTCFSNAPPAAPLAAPARGGGRCVRA